MKGGLGNLMKQAQEMQANMQKAQEEIANLEVTGESGGGLVKVTMTGRHEARRVMIDDSLRKSSTSCTNTRNCKPPSGFSCSPWLAVNHDCFR